MIIRSTTLYFSTTSPLLAMCCYVSVFFFIFCALAIKSLNHSMCGGGFIFIFSRSSYRETLLVALPLHLTFWGLTQVGIESTNACLLTNVQNSTKVEN